MRIAFLVERPTQFEAPLFRFAARDDEHRLELLFTAEAPEAAVYDPELGRSVSWGFDLLEGYAHERVPARGRLVWLWRRFSAEPPDLLIVNGYTRWAFLLATLLARIRGTRTALRIDSALFPDERPPAWLRRLSFSLLLRPLFDVFLATGTLTRRYLDACGVPPARIGMFPYAVDVEGFRRAAVLTPEERAGLRARLGLPEGARVVLSVAKFSRREAPWDLLHAATRLDETHVVLLAGEGPERTALESRAAAQARSRIRFLGYRPYVELPNLYAASDLFVHPVREERWGVSVAEAMACGKPVVASTRVGSAHDLVGPGRNGFLYPAGDAEALAERIKQALALDPAEVAREDEARLTAWGYEAAWSEILRAARCASMPAAG